MTEVLQLPHGRLTHYGKAQGFAKPALVICPGGGYEFCSIREGAPVARAFARDGIEAFVLAYDCVPVPLGTMPVRTAAAAVAWVREHAAQFHINPDRIAIGGFSAGGHLAGTLAAVWNKPEWFEPGTDLQAHRPNAAVLCYPVVSAGEHAHRGSFVQLVGAERDKQQVFSLEYLVDGDMPPTFLWHTLDDDEVPVENTLLIEQALRRAGVPHEMHLFPHGVHGLSLADYETYEAMRGRLPDWRVNRWQALYAEWLKNLG